MYYYLANKNTHAIAESIFGEDLRAMQFVYNKKYKYWYRITEQGIIQFLGLSRYSGGRYELSLLCQPLFVPVYEGFIEDRHGVAPSFEAFNANVMVEYMTDLGMISARRFPKLKGRGYDTIEAIKLHMRMTYDIVVKPTIERSLDVKSCLREFRYLYDIIMRAILPDVSSVWYSDWEQNRYLVKEIDALSLLYLREYDELDRAIEKDMSVRRKYDLPPLQQKPLMMIQQRDESAIAKFLSDAKENTIRVLRKYEFNI